MSWIDNIQNTDFSITTGDGKVWTPKWENDSKERLFNLKEFEYINLGGTFADRKKHQSLKLSFTVWFDGNDNITQSKAFDESAKDKRRWKVVHPFYGTLYGQPSRIFFNDTSLNATKISIDFRESISGNLPKSEISILDTVKSNKEDLINTSSRRYGNVVDLEEKDKNIVKASLSVSTERTSSILDDSTFEEYNTAKSKAFGSVDKIIAFPEDGIRDVQNVLSLPSEFELSVTSRIELFKGIYGDALNVLKLGSKNDKAYFEAQGASLLSAMGLTAITPMNGDYISRVDVDEVIDDLNNLYIDYLQNLDNAQSEDFSPDYETQISLQTVIINSLAELFEIAFASRQERLFINDRDTNLIVLTHRFLGLDANDQNIEEFRKLNNIKNKKLFKIEKGTIIRYLV